MESPPKRVTRARAAAKGTDTTVKTTRIITAAARAKASTSAANSKSTSTKRKTRADELDDDDADELEEADDLVKKSTRGRPRKTTDAETHSTATKTTARGRPAKKAATVASRTEPLPTKAPRGRPRKNVDSEAEALGKDDNTSQPATKTVRGRTTATKSSTAGAKPPARKVVKFQEPDKENDGPSTAKESTALGGIRGRPTRKAASSTATRSTARSATKSTASSSSKAKPLSPKKVTQIPVTRMDSSEDELAGGDTPLKRMQKQPIKPPSDLPVSPRKQAAPTPFDDAEDNTLTINNAILNPPELGATAMGSPARRLPASPFKGSMKSPARKMGPVQLPTSMMKPRSGSGDGEPTSPSKPFLQSAAKRPQSPIKGLLFGPVTQSRQPTSPFKSSVLQSPAKRALPGHKPRQTSPEKTQNVSIEATPRMQPIKSSPTPSTSRSPSARLLEEVGSQDVEEEEDVFSGPVGSLKFPGRMSAVLPRDVDPAEAEDNQDMAETDEVELLEVEEQVAEKDNLQQLNDHAAVEEPSPPSPQDCPPELAVYTSSTPSGAEAEAKLVAAATPVNPMFQLRARDLDPCNDMTWESEDDLSPTKSVDVTTTSFHRSPSKSRRVTMGLTSLADQLGSWSPAEPILHQAGAEAENAVTMSVEVRDVVSEQVIVAAGSPALTLTPNASSFFEQEMSAGGDRTESLPVEDELMGEPILEDMIITEEDIELANEANEMSLEGPGPMDNNTQERSFSDEVSEASQEYADENQLPIDPQLVGSDPRVPVTPLRPAPTVFNTTTKVPLKPADYSTPSPVKKRSFSASRVAPRRPSGPTRNATVISYQPTKDDTLDMAAESTPAVGPNTPARSDIWSSMGTPARTPRRDVNPTLLRGAVVYVDVHTSEGADASSIFVELLSQMGARCVKSWNWTPDSESSSTKYGITHVVFKDGGKRTMEKVRQAKGVVHCVGVTWVLE